LPTALCDLEPRSRKSYDRLFKDLAVEDPRGLLDLFGIVPLSDSSVEVDIAPRDVSPPVLQVDNLYRVRSPEREWLVHFEFQTRYRVDLPDRMVRYAASLHLRYGMPVQCVLVLLAERFTPLQIPTRHSIQTESLTISLDYRVVRLWEIDGVGALALNRPRLYPLMPLLRASQEHLIVTAERIAREPDYEERAVEFLTLAGLRYDDKERLRLLERVMSGIFTKENLRDSIYYQELVEEGREEEARELIREVIASRFPGEQPSPELDRIHDIPRLHDIFRVALKAQSPSEIASAISAITTLP
jgi:predicted transposase YdaD